MSEQEAPTCHALKEAKWPGLRALLFGPPLPRCGAPAALWVGGIPYCQACYDRIRADAKSGKNLLGVLQRALGDREEMAAAAKLSAACEHEPNDKGTCVTCGALQPDDPAQPWEPPVRRPQHIREAH